MAVTIDATVGGASSNSFTTLAEANTYMESRLNASSWETDATDDEKNRALVEATRELSVMHWLGERTDGTQALSWPRQWAHDPDSPIQDYYATTVIPQRVKDATMELALQFVKNGTTDVAALDPQSGIKRKKIDVIETEYDTARRPVGLNAYPSVTRHIKPLLTSVGEYSSVLIRG
jgi:hypothetical protein